MDTYSALATIPWFTLGPWDIGPLTIQGFGLMVAIGVILAYQIVGWRSPGMGLSFDKAQALALYMLISGFIGSHFIDLLLYQPEVILNDPAKLFKFGSSLSSYGGIIGAMGGIVFWKYRNVGQDALPYLDVCAFSLPVGWFFGRVGCAVVHDHPGAPSDFALAVVWPDGVARHDLGLYEAIWWIGIILIFVIANRTSGTRFRQRPGFFLALLPLVYAPVRFALDFMRKPEDLGGDARYFGLTPAQYISMAAFSFGVFLMIRWMNKKTVQREDARAITYEEPQGALATVIKPWMLNHQDPAMEAPPEQPQRPGSKKS